MAMDATSMAEEIYAEMESVYWPSTPLPPDAEAETKKYYKTLAAAIIKYVKANLDVLPGSFNIPSAGTVVGSGKVT